MSVLAYVIDRGALAAEPAATQALAYILNSNPEVARAFVGMLYDANIDFEPGRIEAEQGHGEARPDLTVQDSDGHVRVFVENKFWAGLTAAQPVTYLKEMRQEPPSALLFIVPEQRMASVWNELKSRCGEAGLEWADAPGGSVLTWARVGCDTMLIVSWRYVLDRLLNAASAGGHDDLGRDILQLQALTDRMDTEAFLPLRAEEAADQETARRINNYVDLISDIIGELKRAKIADTQGLRWGNTAHSSGHFINIHAHHKFESWLGIHIIAWREAGISPLWLRFGTRTGVVADHFKTIPKLFEDVRLRHNELYVPIRLKIGVEREGVIADVVAQIEKIADTVLRTIPND